MTTVSKGFPRGVAAGAARVRLPAATGGPLPGPGAAAKAAGSPVGRASDAVAHLVRGMTAQAGPAAPLHVGERHRRPDLRRAAALGAATGCRSSVGLAAVALAARRTDPAPGRLLARPGVRALHALAAAGEIGWDKHPSIPARTAAQAMLPRVLLAAAAAGAVAGRDRTESGPSALLAAGAAAGTAAAATPLRALAARCIGSDLPGALIEDAAAVVLAWLGTRRRDGPPEDAP